MIIVYAISSKIKNYIYVGMCMDIDERFRRHNAGYEKTTRPYRPFNLIYTEPFPNRILARKKEKYLKSGVGKEYLKAIRDNKIAGG
jgi:putative endonuclease